MTVSSTYLYILTLQKLYISEVPHSNKYLALLSLPPSIFFDLFNSSFFVLLFVVISN